MGWTKGDDRDGGGLELILIIEQLIAGSDVAWVVAVVKGGGPKGGGEGRGSRCWL